MIERNLRPKCCLSITLLILAFAIFSARLNVFTTSLPSRLPEDYGIAQSSSIIINGTNTFTLVNDAYILNQTIIVEDFASLIIENATVTFNTTDHTVIRLYDYAMVELVDSKIKHMEGSSLRPMDFSVVLITNSTFDFLIGHDSASISIAKSILDIVHAYGSVVSIIDTQIRFVGGHYSSSISIVNSMVNTIYTSDDASVSMDNCTVSYLVDIYQSSSFSASNSTLNNVYIYGSSVVSLVNSITQKIDASGSTYVSVIDSTVGWFSSRNASITNSTLFEINLYFYADANVSLNPLPIGLVNYWNLFVNNTIIKSDFNMTIKNSEIGGWDISGYGFPVVSVINSTISDVSAYFYSHISLFNSEILNNIVTHCSSTVRLINSTIDGVIGLMPYPKDDTKVIVSWYLDAMMMNISGLPLSEAIVEAYRSNGSLIANATTDEAGRARLILYEKLINVTGTFPFANYTVKSTYNGYMNETLIESINDNMKIIVTFSVILGDVSRDGIVDVRDLVLVTVAYGSTSGDWRWNPNADQNDDDIINFHDFMVVLINMKDQENVEFLAWQKTSGIFIPK